jgi:hypothetical protein
LSSTIWFCEKLNIEFLFSSHLFYSMTGYFHSAKKVWPIRPRRMYELRRGGHYFMVESIFN